MATSFKIVIDSPCTENWGNMQSTNNGRFCSSCEKVVVDFSQFTDQELVKWFKENHGKTCGRLNPDQLNRLIIPKLKFSIQKLKSSLYAASLLAFLSLPKLVKASAKINHPTIFVEQKFKIDAKKTNFLKDSLITIKGRVVDKENKQPIPSLTVAIKGSGLKYLTDKNGNFEIKLNKNIAKPVLQFLFIGYETKELKLYLNKNIPSLIEMKMSPAILGGLGIIREKNTFDKIKVFLNVR